MSSRIIDVRPSVLTASLLTALALAAGCGDPCLDDGLGKGECVTTAASASGTQTTDSESNESGTASATDSNEGGTAEAGDGAAAANLATLLNAMPDDRIAAAEVALADWRAAH